MDRYCMRLLLTGFVLLLLLVSTGRNGMMVVELRTCEQSHRFRGSCQSESNCAAVCQTEGFSGGHCRGLRCRFSCKKRCSSSTFIVAYLHR